MDSNFKRTAKNKTKRPKVKEIIKNYDTTKKNLINKINSILSGDLKPFPHKAVIIYDKISGKTRTIFKPLLSQEHPEQWFHSLVIDILSPILTTGMSDFTFGSIPDRGLSYGKRLVEKFIKNHPKDIKYGLQIDIRHYYQNINVDILKQRFDKVIRDKEFLKLVYYILDSNEGLFPDGSVKKEGIPIGYYTSQWLANWYLQPFDHYIKEVLKIPFYARNMDDMIFFGRNKKQLHKDFESIREYLSNLGLTVKPNYQIFRFDYIDRKDGQRKGRPFDFIGYKFYRDKITLRKKNFKKARRKAAKINKQNEVHWYSACQIISYIGLFKHTDTHKAFATYITKKVSIKGCKRVISNHFRKLNKKRKQQDANLLQSREPRKTR